MNRLVIAIIISATSLSACAQIAKSAQPPIQSSDPLAISMAKQAIAALSNNTIVGDITLIGNVVSVMGSDYETGTGTFLAKGTNESRVDLTLPSETRSEVRGSVSGIPGGAWSRAGASQVPYASHNCWTDAVWFSPSLWSLGQYANKGLVLTYVGQEQHGGVNTQHIQIGQIGASPLAPIPILSKEDIYLDALSFLPVAISYATHPDNDIGTNIPVEIDFASYQPVNGVLVPFHFQKLLNGLVVLDVTVTSATVNTGLADTLFTIQ